MIRKHIFQAYFGDHYKKIEISHVAGSGMSASFHVYEDRFYIAHIHMTAYGEWRWHSPEKAELQIDDLQALIEIIEWMLLAEEDSSSDPQP